MEFDPTDSEVGPFGTERRRACHKCQNTKQCRSRRITVGLASRFLLAKYRHDAELSLIANAEVGGDNCHRGAILGALLGAAGGTSVFPKRWIEQLHERTTILEEIKHFIESIH